MSVALINDASVEQARHMFMRCCTSSEWVSRMVNSRPYASSRQLRCQADANWQELEEEDYREAFDGHPMIGDVASLKAKYANTKELAAGEQSGMKVADDKVIEALARGNHDYEERFGFIFIVCATGKSAAEMSELLQIRLLNNHQAEIKNAAEEQRKIFQIRLNHLLEKQA